MKKLYVHCLAYNSLTFVERALELFEKQKGHYPIERKLLVDPKFPLTGKLTPEEHSARLAEIAAKYGWDYVRISQNMGVAGNWNWVREFLNLHDGDVLYGCDPDGRPTHAEYLDAMMRVFNADKDCFTVQFNVPGTYVMNLPRDEFTVAGEPVIQYRQLTAWSMGAFDCGWLDRIGGLKQWHPLYGYIEHATTAAAEKLGGHWLILHNYYDLHETAEDVEYTTWKRECAEQKTGLEFGDWLKARHAD